MTTSTSSLHVSTENGVYPSNVTTQVNFVPYVTRPAEIIMLVPVLIISLYLTVAASWYQWKYGQESLKWTNRLCTIAPSMLLLQACLFLIEVCGRNLSDAVCSLYAIVTIFLLIFNKSFVYLVLWLRQHTFYTNPTAARTVPLAILVISYSTLVGVVVLPLGKIVIDVLGVRRGTPVGCVTITRFIGIKLRQAIQVVLYMLFVLVQFILLGLVLYPIASHLRRNRGGRSGNTIQAVIVRLSICTGICVATDVAFLVFIMVGVPEGASMSFMPLVYSYNAVFNVVMLYMSFTDRFDRLVPFNTKIEPRPEGGNKGEETQQSNT